MATTTSISWRLDDGRAGQQQQAARHGDAVVDLAVDQPEVVGYPLGVVAPLADLATQALDAEPDRGQRVVDLVGDARRQQAQFGQALLV